MAGLPRLLQLTARSTGCSWAATGAAAAAAAAAWAPGAAHRAGSSSGAAAAARALRAAHTLATPASHSGASSAAAAALPAAMEAAMRQPRPAAPDAAAVPAGGPAARPAAPQLPQPQPQPQPQPLDESQMQHMRAPSPPPGVKKTFYKRKLPCPPAIEFSSPEGRQVFKEALEAGTMTGFFKLIEQLSTQDEPAFCGLASLAMVLNALSIDPRRTWKGSWRWFHERLLDCCLPLDKVAAEGIVLAQAACLAKCNGARVSLHRAGTFTLPEFRAALLQTAASGEEHVVVSYTRRAFGQTGDGHFSPIGGVHAGRDMALILDTARFKYPPHWVPIPLLFEAMAAVDAATGAPRGYLRLGAEEWPDSVLFTLDLRGGGWREAAEFGHAGAPALVESLARAGEAQPEAILSRLAAAAPLASVGGFVAMRFASSQCARDRCVPHAVRQQVLEELRATPLYQMVWPLLSADPRAAGLDFAAERLCMLLLLQPPTAWAPAAAWADAAQHAQWHKLLETSAVSILESEAKYLRHQFFHIGEVLAEGGEHAVEDCGTCTPKRGAADAAADAAGGGDELLAGPCATGGSSGVLHDQGGGGCCGGH
ncbi:glutathione gamma-glutamylcysteinyltransferase [Raphidocelis subcapitata]|uniref:glutathione gamma-glutamylcysteinyltransferase n=1 Tax=Raphidocelis subcapitata TaxID=307507 RepID=A0A2V0PFY2_9CHLO|nr:glutathione gamma-glutamylcysteinyltransferase [Raphidocelis subcapitata]|eukprot:GBF98758.1 glutathione gamma-glutamylcysteinyltransferase [Raphidocelis subcapitata]